MRKRWNLFTRFLKEYLFVYIIRNGILNIHAGGVIGLQSQSRFQEIRDSTWLTHYSAGAQSLNVYLHGLLYKYAIFDG